MKPELKIKRKQKLGIKPFYDTCMYSLSGIFNYLFHEASAKRFLFSFVVETILVLTLKAKYAEILAFYIILAAILAVELINTAIEAAVDLCTLEIHPLAKIAKDCGSAATFVLTLVSVVICLFVFVPYFIG